MASILAEWNQSTLTLAQRMDHLQHGGGLNGTNLLNSTTLAEDHAKDVLHGTPNADWLISGDGDRIDKLKSPSVGAKKGKRTFAAFDPAAAAGRSRRRFGSERPETRTHPTRLGSALS